MVPIAAGGDPAPGRSGEPHAGEPVDLVFMATGPSELAAIVGGAIQRGFEGLIITGSPGWDAGLLDTAAAPAFRSGQVFGSASFGPWGTDTPGHKKAEAELAAAGSSLATTRSAPGCRSTACGRCSKQRRRAAISRARA